MTDILNYLAERIGIIPFLIGIIFILSALIMLRFPPKKINHFYGYRTPNAMRNQQTWDFSQKYSSIKMLQLGIFLFVVSFLNLVVSISYEISVYLGLGFSILGCIYMFIVTENAIKKKFPNQ